jgi:restriction endonuclease Mrr
MARRRKDDHWIGLVAQLLGFVMLLTLISPQVRQVISAIGVIALSFLGLAVISFTGYGIYRFVTRSQRTDAVERNVEWKALAVDINVEEKPPKTTADLIEQMRAIDWFQFEKLVERVYGKLGYAVTRRGGANPDGGIDLMIEKDGERSAVQCKQWKTWNVGVKSVREFLGAMTDAAIHKGIFITLCGYTADAKQLAEKHGIEIVNEVGLANMIEGADALFDSEALAILKDPRKFCPKCEREMVLRTATKGVGAGRQFWGCSSYPKCRFTMPVT